MAILSFSPSPAKGSTSTVTLNKSELYALAPISGDAFWSDPDNITQVKILYQSSEGGQNKTVIFNSSDASPQAELDFSLKAKNTFEVQFIVLKDHDNGELRLKRNDISGLVNITTLDIQLV